MCGEIREILMLTYVDLQFFNVTTNNSVLFTVQCHLNCKVFGWICFTTVYNVVYNVKIDKYGFVKRGCVIDLELKECCEKVGELKLRVFNKINCVIDLIN